MYQETDSTSKVSLIILLPYLLSKLILSTVGESIIAITKIRNNYGDIQSFKFPIFSKVITLPNIARAIVVAPSLSYRR